MLENNAATGSFLLLSQLYADTEMSEIFSEKKTIQRWLEAEAALATAQSRAGIIKESDAELISRATTLENIDREALWKEARNVGYPILPLVRMISAALPEGPDGRVHYAATTQDIMDTGLALQIRDALDRLEDLVAEFGRALASQIDKHRHTVLAARTHAQQAVPTTLGTKLSSFLEELTRHKQRLSEIRQRVCVISLFGAGGTSAAMGGSAPIVRSTMAEILELNSLDVPWHVARDSIAEFGLLCATIAATCGRFAKEVVDLSRTEIGELKEPDGYHRGASSTMPQKSNPIASEGIIGMAASAGALSSALFHAMQGGHERSAGEWQIEWQVIPQVASLAAGSLVSAVDVAAGMRVYPEKMRENLGAEGGLIMAEAYMMHLAPKLGREYAHELVYEAARRTRRESSTLTEILQEVAKGHGFDVLGEMAALAPENYTGDSELICDAALSRWWKGE